MSKEKAEEYTEKTEEEPTLMNIIRIMWHVAFIILATISTFSMVVMIWKMNVFSVAYRVDVLLAVIGCSVIWAILAVATKK